MTTRSRVVELLAAAAGSCMVAVAVLWPSVLHLRGSIAGDLGDPLLQAWQVAWDGHALRTDPGGLWDANVFHPLERSLAFSDALLGYAPAGLVGSGPDAAVTRYGLLLLLATALAVLGGYVLARQLGASRLGAAVAGLAFGAAPWRAAQLGHLHILSTGGIPLAVALLVRGHVGTLRPGTDAEPRRGRPRWVVAGWLVATWQLTLGFGIGLPFAYALAVLVVVAGVVWMRAGRPRPARRLLVADAAGAATFGVVGLLLALPYLQVVERFPSARRTEADLAFYSPPLHAFVTPPETNRLWGEVTAGLREGLRWSPEMTLAVGATVVVLAVLGAALGSASRRLRVALVGAAVVLLVLALGWTAGGERSPYAWLFSTLPGWQGIRTPGRVVVLVQLVLAVLAAWGVDALRRRLPARAGLAAALGLTALVAAEGLVATPVLPVPKAPVALGSLEPPLLVVSPGPVYDTRVMLWSTDGFPAVVNGLSGFEPPPTQRARQLGQLLPDPTAARLLADAYGVRTVVVPEAGAETAAAFADAGLPGRQEGGALVVPLPR